MVSRRLFYGGICTAAFGAGFYRGVCAEKGVQITPMADIILTYAPPLGGAGIAFLKEAGIAEGGHISPPAGLAILVFGAAGAAAAGIGATVCELAGYAAGYLASKI